jgi:hypothetical protein
VGEHRAATHAKSCVRRRIQGDACAFSYLLFPCDKQGAKDGRYDSADVRDKAENRGQNSSQHRTGDPDHPQAGADQDAKGDVQGELEEKKPAQPRRRIVQGGGFVCKSCEPASLMKRLRRSSRKRMQVLPLQEDDDEYRGDAGGRERT